MTHPKRSAQKMSRITKVSEKMGFVSSCFELAEENVKKADHQVKWLTFIYNHSSWWQFWVWIPLQFKIDRARAALSDAKSQYTRLWE